MESKEVRSMTNDIKKNGESSLYKDLQALSNLSFPKECATCGKRYETVDEFIFETQALTKSSGLKEEEDGGQIIVELFRNCICGSTLMDEFGNRRDHSLAGIKRREKFSELLERLTGKGILYETARRELIKVMHGEGSPLLKVKASTRDWP